MVTYILCVENCQRYILTHSCLPIAGRLFYNVRKFHGPRIWECNINIVGRFYHIFEKSQIFTQNSSIRETLKLYRFFLHLNVFVSGALKKSLHEGVKLFLSYSFFGPKRNFSWGVESIRTHCIARMYRLRWPSQIITSLE